MGPAATVDFYGKLVRATPAARDQDHLRVVMWADPTVPNRQAALLSAGEDPTPWLEEGVQRLLQCGAEILVVPCNTVHAYLPAVVEGKDVEFISVIDTTVEAVRVLAPGGRIGILATDGALASGLYQSRLQAAGMEVHLPAESTQSAVMELVRAVKAGKTGPEEHRKAASLLTDLTRDGVVAVIAGCTEISVLIENLDLGVPIVDPSEVLALATVERARTHA